MLICSPHLDDANPRQQSTFWSGRPVGENSVERGEEREQGHQIDFSCPLFPFGILPVKRILHTRYRRIACRDIIHSADDERGYSRGREGG